jgi:hypothetical protein
LTVGPWAEEELPRSGRFTEILYATDFNPQSAAAAAYAVSLAQEFRS